MEYFLVARTRRMHGRLFLHTLVIRLVFRLRIVYLTFHARVARIYYGLHSRAMGWCSHGAHAPLTESSVCCNDCEPSPCARTTRRSSLFFVLLHTVRYATCNRCDCPAIVRQRQRLRGREEGMVNTSSTRRSDNGILLAFSFLNHQMLIDVF